MPFRRGQLAGLQVDKLRELLHRGAVAAQPTPGPVAPGPKARRLDRKVENPGLAAPAAWPSTSLPWVKLRPAGEARVFRGPGMPKRCREPGPLLPASLPRDSASLARVEPATCRQAGA
eukprot:5298923-Alexandrium_andersonii.AAC.1